MQPSTLRNELLQVSFLCISRATTALHLFWAATLFLQESFIYYYYKKVKQRFSNKKDFVKTCSKSTRKNFGILGLNKMMSKLLTVSKCLQLNC